MLLTMFKTTKALILRRLIPTWERYAILLYEDISGTKCNGTYCYKKINEENGGVMQNTDQDAQQWLIIFL